MTTWALGKVTCDYLELVPPTGPRADVRPLQPVCTKQGSPNDPPALGPPFVESCRTCPENRWLDKD